MPLYQAHARELLNQKEDDSGDVYVGEPLYQATERVAAALRRLEHSLHVPAGERIEGARRGEQLIAAAHENEILRQERETLVNALDQMQQQYEGLETAAATIYRKLGDTIKRLTQIIGD